MTIETQLGNWTDSDSGAQIIGLLKELLEQCDNHCEQSPAIKQLSISYNGKIWGILAAHPSQTPLTDACVSVNYFEDGTAIFQISWEAKLVSREHDDA